MPKVESLTKFDEIRYGDMRVFDDEESVNETDIETMSKNLFIYTLTATSNYESNHANSDLLFSLPEVKFEFEDDLPYLKRVECRILVYKRG